MARTTIEIDAPVDEAWPVLQQLATWEGVAGIEDLRDAEYDGAGNLTAFRFATDTAVGRVNGRASVQAAKPAMAIRAEQKGLRITLQVELHNVGVGSHAHVQARAKASSFFSMPLELTVNAMLDGSIEREAAKIARRIGKDVE